MDDDYILAGWLLAYRRLVYCVDVCLRPAFSPPWEGISYYVYTVVALNVICYKHGKQVFTSNR